MARSSRKLSANIFDAESINALIHALEATADDLDTVCDAAADTVSEIGEVYARTGYASAVVDIEPRVMRKRDVSNRHVADVTVSRSGGEGSYTVEASGSEVLFAEFGTGITLNGSAGSSPHPWGEEEGMLIGEYGKGNGSRPVWRFDKNKATIGSPAYNVMYTAFEKMKDEMSSAFGAKLK